MWSEDYSLCAAVPTESFGIVYLMNRERRDNCTRDHNVIHGLSLWWCVVDSSIIRRISSGIVCNLSSELLILRIAFWLIAKKSSNSPLRNSDEAVMTRTRRQQFLFFETKNNSDAKNRQFAWMDLEARRGIISVWLDTFRQLPSTQKK